MNKLTDRAQEGPRVQQVHIEDGLCKACGICVELCAREVFDAPPGKPPIVARPDDCNGCRSCELHCPDFAIRTIRTRLAENKPLPKVEEPV